MKNPTGLTTLLYAKINEKINFLKLLFNFEKKMLFFYFISVIMHPRLKKMVSFES